MDSLAQRLKRSNSQRTFPCMECDHGRRLEEKKKKKFIFLFRNLCSLQHCSFCESMTRQKGNLEQDKLEHHFSSFFWGELKTKSNNHSKPFTLTAKLTRVSRLSNNMFVPSNSNESTASAFLIRECQTLFLTKRLFQPVQSLLVLTRSHTTARSCNLWS